MASPCSEVEAWFGHELFDVNGRLVGTIDGLAFPRRKFGSCWLVVAGTWGKNAVVPAEPITVKGERLVLQYVKGYIETGPALVDDQPLSKAEEQRLALHWGFSNRMPGSQCHACGLCLATRRAQHRRE